MPIVAYSGIAPIAGSTITVRLTGTYDLADLFADEIDTPLANPFTADETTGAYLFYATDDEVYDIVTTGEDPPSVTVAMPPTIIFSGETPTRTASLVVVDPVTDEQIILAQVIY